MAGRCSKPTALKILQGNPGKRPLPKNEPQPDVGSICPEWVSEHAMKNWDLISKNLELCGILTVIDSNALALYCDALGRFIYYSEEIEKTGEVIETATGNFTINPYVKLRDIAFEQIRRLSTEFGMTPASRTRVKVAPTKKQNPFQEMKA